MSEAGERRQGIQSVGIGLRVLEVLAAQNGAAALGAIAQASDLSASQAHRYLASLIAAGMARQDTATGRYELGPGALRLGLAALSRMDSFREAAIALTDYVAETGRTVQMGALGPTGPIVVRWIMGTPAISTSLMVGSPLPLLSSATGHVFLAFRPEAATRQMVERETQPQFQPVDVEGACSARRLFRCSRRPDPRSAGHRRADLRPAGGGGLHRHGPGDRRVQAGIRRSGAPTPDRSVRPDHAGDGRGASVALTAQTATALRRSVAGSLAVSAIKALPIRRRAVAKSRG